MPVDTKTISELRLDFDCPKFKAIESHTEGMATRIIYSGVPAIPGKTMAEKRINFQSNHISIRDLLLTEPRGHGTLSGAILLEPCNTGADVGVIFLEVSALPTMCGHATIAVVTLLIEAKLIDAPDGVTTIHLDTPAGLVRTTATVNNGKVERVEFTSFPAYIEETGTVDLNPWGIVRYELAYAGTYFVMCNLDEIGISFRTENKEQLLEFGMAVMDALNKKRNAVNDPLRKVIHAYLEAPRSTSRRSKHVMVHYPGWYDRSPCGTGTCARLAQLYTQGQMKVGDELKNHSFIGTSFSGKIIDTVQIDGRPAIIATVSGQAWITGSAEYYLDKTDPFQKGFLV